VKEFLKLVSMLLDELTGIRYEISAL